VRFPIEDRDKIDFSKPTFTFDVNVIGIKSPSEWGDSMQGVAELEYNYLETNLIEIGVTPQTSGEIVVSPSLASAGSSEYARFTKSEFFKSRPPGTALTLSDQEADDTWCAIRGILWRTVSDEALTPNQRADVSQVFFHLSASGTLANSAFVTNDGNFHEHRDEIQREFGIQILRPSEAWGTYQPRYDLYTPTDEEVIDMWHRQSRYLTWAEAARGTKSAQYREAG
jgi:hypothetical protein